MTLTKADLAQRVYERHENMTKQKSVEAVEAFLRLSKNSLISGSDLLLSGFGKFNVRDKGARRGRNPQTGDELTLDSRRVVTFKPRGFSGISSMASNGPPRRFIGFLAVISSRGHR